MGTRDMRTTRSDLDSQSSQNQQTSQGYTTNQEVSVVSDVGTPWLQEEDMGQEEVPSLSVCLSIYLSNLQQTCAPLENKMREIYFIKKCVSFVHWSSFIIFDYVLGWVYEKYMTHGGHQTVCQKGKKELEILLQAVRIYSMDIGIKFGTENTPC